MLDCNDRVLLTIKPKLLTWLVRAADGISRETAICFDPIRFWDVVRELGCDFI